MEAKEWVAREVAHVRTDSLAEGREEGLSIGPQRWYDPGFSDIK